MVWNEACKKIDKSDLNGAMAIFQTIAETAKIHFNLGQIHEHQRNFTKAASFKSLNL